MKFLYMVSNTKIKKNDMNNNTSNNDVVNNRTNYITSFAKFIYKFTKQKSYKYISTESSFLFIVIIDIFIFNNYLLPFEYYFNAYIVGLVGILGHAIMEFMLFSFDEFMTHLYNKLIKEQLESEKERYT